MATVHRPVVLKHNKLREPDEQSVSQAGRQAVRQAVGGHDTHSSRRRRRRSPNSSCRVLSFDRKCPEKKSVVSHAQGEEESKSTIFEHSVQSS